MIQERELIINHLPMKTWYWLKINDKNAKIAVKNEDFPAEVLTKGGIAASEDESFAETLSGIETGMGKEFEAYIESQPYLPDLFVAEEGKDAELSIRFDYDRQSAGVAGNDADAADDAAVPAKGQALNLYHVVAKKGSNLTIYTDHLSRNEGTAVVDFRILVEAGAKVKLVQSHRFSEDFRFFSNVGVKVEEEGSFELVTVAFSGKEMNLALCTDLSGDRSRARYDIGYVSGNASDIDQNYLIRYRGKDTEGEIFSNGVLKGTTVKRFRGTIDFIRGCVGAKGAEKEDVLLLDDRAVNKTAPLILCGEEDVEGEHGATIGKLADEVLFYLRARGVSEEDAYSLIANGRMNSVIERIPETDLTDLKKELKREVFGVDEIETEA